MWAYLTDILILDESLNTIEFLAALTILLVALGIAIYKLRKQNQADSQPISSVNPVSEAEQPEEQVKETARVE